MYLVPFKQERLHTLFFGNPVLICLLTESRMTLQKLIYFVTITFIVTANKGN